MAFAGRYIVATAEAYDEIIKNSGDSEIQLAAIRGKLVVATAAVGAAVQSSPLAGLMDLAVLATLTRAIAERPSTASLYGAAQAANLASVLTIQERDVWSVAELYLTPAQRTELKELSAQWLTENPNQRYAINVEIAQLARKERTGAGKEIIGSVVGVITLDPFTGLDPAVKEVEQTRALAERMFFYMRHMPVLLTWQADSLYLQLMETPPSKALLADTRSVANSTTQFSQATSRFADASSQIAKSVENFRAQLPDQQKTLVEQLNQTIATQRDAALQQATTQLASQQDDLTRNLATVTDSSIDRLYVRARALILLTVGAILAAMIIYRMIVRPRSKPTTPA